MENQKLNNNMKKILLLILLLPLFATAQVQFGPGATTITGQGTQTASGNNIILATAGTGSYDAITYNTMSISIIVTGTVTSGAVTFEGSNDNTNFTAFTLFDDTQPYTNPVTSINPLTGVNRYLSGPIHFRYIRARISTVIGGGGSLQAITKLDNKTYQPDVVAITQDDISVTGQSAQTATVNNILTVASGTAATDLSGYKSASVQVNSTGTAGTYIFEGSNDNSAFVTIPVWNQLILTGTPITAAVTASNTKIVYIFPVTTRYVRLRIATTITGGSIQAISKFSQAPFAPGIQQVAQATGANLNVAVSSLPTLGTVTTVSTVTTLANGQTAHSSASTGSPLRMAGRVAPTTAATQDQTLVAGDASDINVTTGRQLIQKPYETAENDWHYAAAASGIVSSTTAVTFKAASGTAGIRNYITSIEIGAFGAGTATELAIRDGAAGTVIWRIQIPAAGLPAPVTVNFTTPLRGTANTLLEVVTLTSSATPVFFNAHGYTGF